MALAIPEPEHLDAKEILRKAEERIKKYQMRDTLYDTYELYYRGKQPSAGSFNVMAMNPQGRVLLRDLGKAMEQSRAYSSQRLAPIVDDFQALMGRMPNTRVEPPDPSPQGEEKAALLTKYLISTHELSDMDRQHAEVGYHLSGLGDACYMMEVEPVLRRVVWTVVNPRCAYPEFFGGYKRYQVYDMVLRYRMAPDAIKREYGFMPRFDKDEDCDITVYVSPFQRTVVIGSEQPQLGPDVSWDLGFCPVQWVFNKANGQMAQSDIGQSLSQQDFLDYAYNVLIDGLVHNVYPLVGIKNPHSMGQDPMVVGPGAPPIMLQDNGDIIIRQTGGDIGPAMSMIQQTNQDIDTAAGTSQVRQHGMPDRSNISGKALHAAQGPQGTRIELKQQTLGAALREANAVTVLMQEKAPLLGRHKFEIFGRFQGKSFREEISAQDLKWEGRIWTRNTVTWDSMVGMNIQQKTAVAYEGMMAGLIDDLAARELMGIDDPLGMRERIRAHKLYEATIQADSQKLLQPMVPPPGQGGGAPQQGAAPAPAPGAPPPVQPAIFRPPSLMRPGQPAAGQAGVTRKDVEAALAKIASKLKGTVYAVGELALQGTATRVELMIADHRDYQQVLQAVRALAPNVQVKAIGKDDLPEDAIRVA